MNIIEYRKMWHEGILNDENMMKLVHNSVSNSKMYQSLNYGKASLTFKKFAEKKRNFDGTSSTNVLVCNDDVATIISKNKDKHLCVLNYSSYTDPGGEFLKGSLAQEEALCHVSGLYEVLCSFADTFYAPHWKTKHFGKYTHSMLVSIDVPFKIDGEIILVDVITCAACNLRRTLRYDRNNIELLEDMRLAMIERQELVYLMAACTKCDSFITGPWGCGVFKNDPWDIANNWKSCIEEYNGLLSEVVMSVPGDLSDRNVEIFYRLFG